VNDNKELIAEARAAAPRSNLDIALGFNLLANLADALEAAQPRTVTTVEELDALPDGSVIRTVGNEIWAVYVKDSEAGWDDRVWLRVAAEIPFQRTIDHLPALILYTPPTA